MKTTLLVLSLNEIEGMKRMMAQIEPEWCDQILVFTWCQDEELADCLKAAGHLFGACLAHCDHQAKRGNGPRPRNR